MSNHKHVAIIDLTDDQYKQIKRCRKRVIGEGKRKTVLVGQFYFRNDESAYVTVVEVDAETAKRLQELFGVPKGTTVGDIIKSCAEG